MSAFGALIKQRREQLGLSQWGLSAKSGVAVTRVQAIEAGKNCTMETAGKIAAALGIGSIPVG